MWTVIYEALKKRRVDLSKTDPLSKVYPGKMIEIVDLRKQDIATRLQGQLSAVSRRSKDFLRQGSHVISARLPGARSVLKTA